MKYIHDYKNNDFCESESFESKVDGVNYIAISDEDYEDLLIGKKLLQNGELVNNPNYVEREDE